MAVQPCSCSSGGRAHRSRQSCPAAVFCRGEQLAAIRRVLAAHAQDAQLARRSRARGQPVEQCDDALAPVAHGQHVAACSERGLGARHDVADHARAFHRQVIREHDAAEVELAAQHIGDPATRKARGHRIDVRIEHVRHHHGGQIVRDETAVRQHVFREIRELAPVHRERQMRVGDHCAMPGKVLGGRRHAGAAHAQHRRHREIRDDLEARE